MAVNAASEGGIEIATVSGSTIGTYGTIASAAMTSVSLLPTSTDNTTRWVHASAAITTDKQLLRILMLSLAHQLLTMLVLLEIKIIML